LAAEPRLPPPPPFGGYKLSGNGREWNQFDFDGYLEIKAAAVGYALMASG
jgi:acyl-CoA reductase-like NAD-dependent aldehyde dehydrogenase